MNITSYFKSNTTSSSQKNRVHFVYVKLREEQMIEKNVFAAGNYLLFNISGRINCLYEGINSRTIDSGQILFCANQVNCMLTAKTEVSLIIVKFGGLVHLCDRFTFQLLSPYQSLLKYDFNVLDIRYPLDTYLQLMTIYLEKGIDIEHFYTEKLKELFIIFRAYYTKEELAMFFYLLIAKDMDFRNKVLENYLKAKTVEELAELCGYGNRVFLRHFKEIFGEVPLQWMHREKAKRLRYYLTTTHDASQKEVVEKFHFDSVVHLNKFCKKWFGMTPTELKYTMELRNKLIKN